MRRALLVALLAITPLAASAADTRRPPLAGRPLSEAIRLLETQGLSVVFSTELVGPDMRVSREPRAKDPRKALEEILAPHDLALSRGPGGRWLVVGASTPKVVPTPVPDSPPVHFQEKVDVAGQTGPEPLPSGVTVPSTQVRATAGGLENVFHTLQLLPGVTAPLEFAGRVAVRGGSPDQNLTIMDGVEVHNPFRLFGLTSAFNPETVDRFELFTGTFSAQYGDRLSSLLVVDNREGSAASRLQGSASIGLTDSDIVLEGRLPGSRRGSWLAAARRTYYDLVAERMLDANLPGFADLQTKVAWELRPGQKLTFQGLLSGEGTDASSYQFDGAKSDLRVVSRAHTGVLAGTWDAALGGRAHLRSILSSSNVTDSFDFESRIHNESRRSNAPLDDAARNRIDFVRSVSVRDLAWREDLALTAGRHALRTGLEMHLIRSHWGLADTGDTSMSFTGTVLQFGDTRHVLPDAVDSRVAGPRAAAWIEDRWQPASWLTVVPGLRYDHIDQTGEDLVSPRLAANVRLGRATRLRLGAGLHYQSPGYEKIYLGDDFVDLTRPGPRGLRSERAWQAVLGFERDLGAGLSLRLEAYRRRLDRLIVGRLETEDERAARVARYDFPPSLRSDVPVAPLITVFPANEGRGEASGLELLVAKRPVSAQTRLVGWFSYSFGNAEREAYGVTAPFVYDRRHSASLVGQLRVSPRLELSAAAHAASGVPFTPARGVRVFPMEDVADLDGDGNRSEWIPARDASTGALIYETDLGPVSNTNSRRLPGISRLDFRVGFKPRGPSGRWGFYLEVINALGRQNGFLVTPELRFNPDGPRPTIGYAVSGGFPRVPSFGVQFRF